MTTPDTPAGKNPLTPVLAVGCGIPAALVLGGILLVALWPRSDTPTVGESIVACENAVEQLLRAPATASFSSTASGTERVVVDGYVDSENGFGALVRSDYQCTVVGGRAEVMFLEQRQ